MATKKSTKKGAGKKKATSKKASKKTSTIKPRVIDLRKRGAGGAKAEGLYNCPGDCARLTVSTGAKPTHLLIVV